ncbi:MAG: hypothetical protein QGF59_14615 [Pirellulaceae bacterium]|jgi:hypothetical protein|nr:hypothetical protein [Pirellulaceae bacterium]
MPVAPIGRTPIMRGNDVFSLEAGPDNLLNIMERIRGIEHKP